MGGKQRGIFRTIEDGLSPSQHVERAQQVIKLHEYLNSAASRIDDDLADAIDKSTAMNADELHAYRQSQIQHFTQLTEGLEDWE